MSNTGAGLHERWDALQGTVPSSVSCSLPNVTRTHRYIGYLCSTGPKTVVTHGVLVSASVNLFIQEVSSVWETLMWRQFKFFSTEKFSGVAFIMLFIRGNHPNTSPDNAFRAKRKCRPWSWQLPDSRFPGQDNVFQAYLTLSIRTNEITARAIASIGYRQMPDGRGGDDT